MMKKGFQMMNVGASSFLVIFTVLALVTFAVLSVSSANADKQLSDIAFNKEMGGGQALAVSLTLPPEGTTYQITRWQVISTNDWQPDNTLPVITLN